MRRVIWRAAAVSAAAVVTVAAAAGCSGSSMSNDAGGGDHATLNVGFLTAESGVYKAVGDDMTNGARLYLKKHGGKLGGHKINLVVGDHGQDTSKAQTVANKMIKQDKVVAAAGVVDSDTMLAVQSRFNNAKIPLIGANSAGDTTGKTGTSAGLKYLWHSSYDNEDPAKAIAKYVAEQTKAKGQSVYILMPDYGAGHDEDQGFRKPFLAAGGKLANGGKSVFTPFPKTMNFQPYLQKIKDSGAKAVWSFYAGAEAIAYVKQFKQFLGGQGITLYGPGWMTDGSVLQAEGDAAKGVVTVDNYASDLDNAENRAFESAYRQAYNTEPSPFSMAAWDSMMVLDEAISHISGKVTSDDINTAIGKIGTFSSPRGDWQFSSKRTPIQKWYLRKVQDDGPDLNNVVVQTLATVGADQS